MSKTNLSENFPQLNDYFDDEPIVRRDTYYANLLSAYINHQNGIYKQQRWMKVLFFVVVLTVFVCTIIGSLFVLLSSLSEPSNTNAIANLIASTTTLIATIIVLPKIIAKHLFPETKDLTTEDILRNVMITDYEQPEAPMNNKKE